MKESYINYAMDNYKIIRIIMNVVFVFSDDINSLYSSSEGTSSNSTFLTIETASDKSGSVNGNNELLDMFDDFNETRLYSPEAILGRLSSDFKRQLCTSIVNYVSDTSTWILLINYYIEHFQMSLSLSLLSLRWNMVFVFTLFNEPWYTMILCILINSTKTP